LSPGQTEPFWFRIGDRKRSDVDRYWNLSIGPAVLARSPIPLVEPLAIDHGERQLREHRAFLRDDAPDAGAPEVVLEDLGDGEAVAFQHRGH
jgi:hypothetical protein